MNRSFLKTRNQVKDWFEENFKAKMSFDIETDGVGYDCQLKGISVCNGTHSFYVNLESAFKDTVDIIWQHLCYCNLLIGHNLSFDLRVLKQLGYGFDGVDIYDTMVSSHLLNENASCALKDVVRRKKFDGWENVIDFKEAVSDGYSSQKFLNYAISDAEWTWQLYELTKPLLIKQGLDKLFYKVEMPFQFVLIDLYLNGIKVDVKKLKEFEDILTAEKVLQEENCVESVGLKMIETKFLFGICEPFDSCVELKSPINLNSSQQIAKIIEEQLGFELPRTKPSKRFPEGQPSTTSEILEPLQNKHPFIKHLLKFRKAEKLLNTFVLPLYGKIDKDGRLRTSFNDCIAGTGRLSSSGPNLQNIPKEVSEDDIVNIREIFVAEKGKKFVRADYDLQEIRQLANVSGDKNLIHILNSGQDVHLASANGCLNLGLTEQQLIKTNPEFEQLKKRFKKERHIGKNGINFPVIYGSTKYGVSRNNNVSEDEAQSWIDGFFSLYPEVGKSIKICRKFLRTYGYVKTYFDRKRRLHLKPNTKQNKAHNEHCYRQAFNMLIQGMCADLLRITLNKLEDCYFLHPEWKAKLCLTVHDDVITECKKEYATEVLKAKKGIMENTVIDLPVKFLVDINICDSYGD
jgi:DNA polymerase-1